LFKCTSCYDFRNGLAGYYKFDGITLAESLIDISGNWRTLTAYNNPTYSSSIGLSNTGGL
jgi:hypothetical protein